MAKYNLKRDKFLVEYMGGCWHDETNPINHHYAYGTRFKCLKCGEEFWGARHHPDFEEWQGFGWLWDKAKGKEWWDDFCKSTPHKAWLFPIGWIHPDRFADALYEFLKERGK